jgi:hypothetical protein
MIKVRDSQVAPSRHAETAKDRRRPGRIDSVSPTLIPLLRNPTEGAVAGDLAPVDRFKSLLALAEVYAAGHYELHDATGSKFRLQTTCRSGDQLPYAPCGWFWLLADERTEAEKSQAMKVAPVDAASLTNQADRCRRLAAGIADGEIKVTLLALAVEYELRADQVAGE